MAPMNIHTQVVQATLIIIIGTEIPAKESHP